MKFGRAPTIVRIGPFDITGDLLSSSRLGKLGVLEQRKLRVLLAEDRIGDRPFDSDGRIVPEDAALVGRVVEIGALVDDLGVLAEDAEAVKIGRASCRERV